MMEIEIASAQGWVLVAMVNKYVFGLNLHGKSPSLNWISACCDKEYSTFAFL